MTVASLPLLKFGAASPISTAHAQAAGADAAWRPGLSLFGDLKYPAGFPRFDYVNPDAPKGGVVRLLGRLLGDVIREQQGQETFDQIEDIRTRSVREHRRGERDAKLGDTLTLDGRGSYSRDSTIVKYEWDLDGDGTYDLTTDQPDITHTFTSPIDGDVTLRVTDAKGHIALATTRLSISRDGDEIPDAQDVDLWLEVNGRERQRGSTRSMAAARSGTDA